MQRLLVQIECDIRGSKRGDALAKSAAQCSRKGNRPRDGPFPLIFHGSPSDLREKYELEPLLHALPRGRKRTITPPLKAPEDFGYRIAVFLCRRRGVGSQLAIR